MPPASRTRAGGGRGRGWDGYSEITSAVGRRNIRYARLKSATRYTASCQDCNSLVRLCLEISTIASVDQRGSSYIFDNPDLVVAARDIDAKRRLFESKSDWPGARHARLAIANILSGDLEEANRHINAVTEWVDQYIRSIRDSNRSDRGPDRIDIAAIALFLMSQHLSVDAAKYLSQWQDWYVYEICGSLFGFAQLRELVDSTQSRMLKDFVDELSGIGPLSAALSFLDLPEAKCKTLLAKLASRCNSKGKLNLSDVYRGARTEKLQDGLRKSASLALSLGLRAEARTICSRVPCDRPKLWAFGDGRGNNEVFSFIFSVALNAAVKNEAVSEKSLLTQELVPICSRVGRNVSGVLFYEKAKKCLSRRLERRTNPSTEKQAANVLTPEDARNADRFLTQHLEPLLVLTQSLADMLGASRRRLEGVFSKLVDAWEEISKNRDPYRSESVNWLFRRIGFETVFFAFWCNVRLKPKSARYFLKAIHRQHFEIDDLVRLVAIMAQRKDMQDLAGEQAMIAKALIQKEDDVERRGSLLADLSRAMLPASTEEASTYFRDGLEQMDAIGSGDQEFTNELLLFASQMKGVELSDHAFHTLTNIAELNMGEETHKFCWGAFGRGLSRAAGLRGLAKLSRWDDRSKISLRYTLHPYLTGLLEDDKIDAKDALSLNRLANPAETYYSSGKHFAQAIRQQAGPEPGVVAELISQFQDENPGFASSDTIDSVIAIAEEALGKKNQIVKHLAGEARQIRRVRSIQNERSNYRGDFTPMDSKKKSSSERRKLESMRRILASVDPTDGPSLENAFDSLGALGNLYFFKSEIFSGIRKKVGFGDRLGYIRNITSIAGLPFHLKVEELVQARDAWKTSSAAIADLGSEIAYSLVRAHADDLVSGGRLSHHMVQSISNLTGVEIAELTIELIKSFSRPDCTASGATWLSFASILCPEAVADLGQSALTRMLSSETARLADSVEDGPWAPALYPPDDVAEVAAGLVWRLLGSPYAEERWRAATSIRSFAKFGRWKIIDKIVAKIGEMNAGPFQASELPFFYLHARLWLIISLCRISIESPEKIVCYKKCLLSFVLENDPPHVLLRHFASKTLVNCMDSGKLTLPSAIEKRVRTSDRSPYERLKKKVRSGGGFYTGRPGSAPSPQARLSFDYDFNKYDVDNLGQVFGQPCWRVEDLIAEIVDGYDDSVVRMSDQGGRELPQRRQVHGMSTDWHSYGQQLAWHALFVAAGKLLEDHPATDDWYHRDDPWGEWLGRYGLSRGDGLWLSDGTDRTPPETNEFLLRSRRGVLSLTGDRGKILNLVGLGETVGKRLVIEGGWSSADGVRVKVSSCLVPEDRAGVLARRLVRQQPLSVYLPCFDESEDDSEYSHDEGGEYIPWVVHSSREARLDKHDPYGVSIANSRPRLAREFTDQLSLSKGDPFGRSWVDKRGCERLVSQAWGRENHELEDGRRAGSRLFCSSFMLKRLLSKRTANLLILVVLERYEKKSLSSGSTWTHTVGVVRVGESLELEYLKGRVNHLHSNKY